MKLLYKKYQNKAKLSKAYGKWYGRAVITETVSIERMADTMQANCTLKRADILAVLSELGPTISTLVKDSKRVRIPYLGSFKLGLTTTGAEKPELFTSKNVKNVHVIFQPEVHINAQGKRVKDMVDNCELTEAPDYTQPASDDKGGSTAGNGNGGN